MPQGLRLYNNLKGKTCEGLRNLPHRKQQVVN
uniref:Uncharacterized protein n=1 Tax=Anguilla anguilla TaxID=7936 RepID=A0A0E9Q407_ANGAN